MKNQNKSLEKKLEKINWKEFLPIIGIYYVKKDFKKNKPTISQEKYLKLWKGYIVYQGLSIEGSLLGVGYLIKEIL